jgi:DNA-binding CsgD family transcriptional regulator
MTVRTDPQALDLYQRHWGARDPWGRSLQARKQASATVILGDELISHNALKRTDFYCDFGRPYDIVRSAIGLVEQGPQGVSVISVNRTERHQPFDRDDSILLTGLMPHLHRGLQLHRRLAAADHLSDGLEQAVGSVRHAVLLAGPRGQVTFMNAAAATLVSRRDGILIDGRELRASAAADTGRLRALIAQASATTNGEALHAGGTLVIQRPSGRRPLLAVISPLSRTQRADPRATAPLAMLVITDPENPHMPGEEALRVLFTLTLAEAKLARLLATGLSPLQAAAHLGLTLETVRTRTKAILEKTDTHRLTDLVRLVHMLRA